MKGQSGDEAPRVIQWFLERLAPNDEFGRNVIGDLTEEWRAVSASRSPLSRRLWYWRQAIPIGMQFAYRRLFPGAGADVGTESGSRFGSAGQDVFFAVRSLRRNPVHSGLAVTIFALAIAGSGHVRTGAGGLILIAVPASWLAALAAARIDPTEALRRS